MKKKIGFRLVALLLVLAAAIPALAASPVVTFENVSQGEVIVLPVGETYVFEASVASEEAFISAILISDQQLPGRGIFMGGADIATQASAALLSVSARGKASTAGLPGGVVPVSLVVGVRYPGGGVAVEQVDFFIQVP